MPQPIHDKTEDLHGDARVKLLLRIGSSGARVKLLLRIGSSGSSLNIRLNL